jgi:hypothetical protein
LDARVSFRARSLTRESVGNSLSQERLNGSDILFEVDGKTVALLQVIGRIVAQPDFAIRVFPHERLEREVNGGAGSGKHQWSAPFWIAQNQQLRGTHFQASFFGFATVIDEHKNRDTF